MSISDERANRYDAGLRMVVFALMRRIRPDAGRPLRLDLWTVALCIALTAVAPAEAGPTDPKPIPPAPPGMPIPPSPVPPPQPQPIPPAPIR